MLFHFLGRLVLAGLRRRAIDLGCVLAIFAAGSPSMASVSIGPTAREVIEFRRIIQPLNQTEDELRSQISPNGNLAFIVTRRADVATDRNRFEILLLDVSNARLRSGVSGRPSLLLGLEAARDDYDGDPPLREARWVGNGTIVFRARLHDRPAQAYRLDVGTRRVRQLTFEPLGVASFDITRDLRRVVYVAQQFNSPIPPGSRTVIVGTHSFWSVHGPDDLRTQLRRYRYMVSEAGSQGTGRPLGEAFDEGSGSGFPSASISPDGRWALLARYDASRQVAWGRVYPRIADTTAKFGPSVNSDPLGYFSRPRAYVPRRLVAYRLSDGHEQPVLESPDDSMLTNQQRTDRLWQEGGRSVVIAGIYLPPPAPDAVPDASSHIIEYWPVSGKWRDIAMLRKGLKDTLPVPGNAGAFIAIDGEQARRFERTGDGHWIEAESAGEDHIASSAAAPAAPRGGWRLRVDQSLNQPPDIVASGPAGENVRLTRLNPQHVPSAWGTMRHYTWKDVRGRQWNGGLMVPANFDPGRRHAVVIQTYGFSPTRFYRDGANTYDGFTSGFPGRALLRENILVLAMPMRPLGVDGNDLHEQLASFAGGVRGAVDALVAEGIADRDRIGIMGWSTTGSYVLNLLTFTNTPIRAASLLDGDSNTLFSMTITYSRLDGIQLKKEAFNEGPPFGGSLKTWIRNDPSLHTDCIRAALRIEGYGPEVKNNWDIYALMRRQYKPVEMVVFRQGEHALSRPGDRMISLQGNIDWYRFWLNGERRSELVLPGESAGALSEQYKRWEQMARLKRDDDAKPACVRPAVTE